MHSEPDKNAGGHENDSPPVDPELAMRKPEPPAEISTEDTVRIKPGDPLWEAIRAAQDAPRVRPKPRTDMDGTGRMASAALSRGPSPDKGRIENYRRWLEGKSRDELIAMVLGLGVTDPAELTEKIPRLMLEEQALDPIPGGLSIPDDLAYARLPVLRKGSATDPAHDWQVVLIALDQAAPPIGLLVDGEITIGRAAGDANPDLDLTPYGAKNKGVSRIHAHIRPGASSLVLMDAESSNGTFWNRIRVPAHTEQILRDGDVITFGRLNFLLKVIKAPSTGVTKTLI